MREWLYNHRRVFAGWLFIAALAVASKAVAEADPRLIGSWFLILTAPAQTIFAVWYATKRPWRYPGPGRAIWVKATALAALLDVIWLAEHWPAFPHLAYLTAFSEVLIAVGIYWQLATFAHQRWELFTGARADPRIVGMLNEVIDRAKADALLARADALLAADERVALRVLLDRLGVQANEAAASNERMEAATAVVAEDLEAAHSRADDVTGPHGAAADAASQSAPDVTK